MLLYIDLPLGGLQPARFHRGQKSSAYWALTGIFHRAVSRTGSWIGVSCCRVCHRVGSTPCDLTCYHLANCVVPICAVAPYGLHSSITATMALLESIALLLQSTVLLLLEFVAQPTIFCCSRDLPTDFTDFCCSKETNMTSARAFVTSERRNWWEKLCTGSFLTLAPTIRMRSLVRS